MASYTFPKAMRSLIMELSKLPTIGEKSAIRLAYHLVKGEDEDAVALARAILEAKEKIGLCQECFSFAEGEKCQVCADPTRDHQIVCVVEKPADVIAIERSGGYCGLYHVLHGLWSPLKGIGPEETKIGQLVQRVKNSIENATVENPQIKELILATSTTVEGDATALYIARNVASLGVSVTRIAQGMPKGGELEYADQGTLSHALKGRSKL